MGAHLPTGRTVDERLIPRNPAVIGTTDRSGAPSISLGDVQDH
jgi:hypothetical protein